jgi:hypothetical protein
LIHMTISGSHFSYFSWSMSLNIFKYLH